MGKIPILTKIFQRGWNHHKVPIWGESNNRNLQYIVWVGKIMTPVEPLWGKWMMHAACMNDAYMNDRSRMHDAQCTMHDAQYSGGHSSQTLGMVRYPKAMSHLETDWLAFWGIGTRTGYQFERHPQRRSGSDFLISFSTSLLPKHVEKRWRNS